MKLQDVIANREYALDSSPSQGCLAFPVEGMTHYRLVFDVLPEKDEVNRL